MRICACVAILIAACGGQPHAAGQPPVLSISPAEVELKAGATQKFSANLPAAWSLAEGPGAGTIASDGTYTAPATSGIVHVVARTGTTSASATVRVIASVEVAVDPPAVTLAPGMTTRFRATVTGAPNLAVSWSIAEGSAGGTVYPEGVYIAPLAEGTYHLVASSLADPSRTATATVTVSGAMLAVDPPSATLAAGDRLSFRSRPGVVWSVQEGAAGGSITQGGAYLAPVDHGGTFHIVATSGVESASAVVTVLSPDLLDHGGPIAPATRTFALWWGAAEAWADDVRSTAESLLGGLDGSAYLALANQYLRGASASTRFAGSFDDSSTAPTSPDKADSATVGGKACDALIAGGVTPAPGDAVVVYGAESLTPPPTYCAWHSSFNCRGVNLLVAFVPNVKNSWSCLALGAPQGCNELSSEANAAASLTAHELMEAITDPFGTAWTDAHGEELGDMCEEKQVCVTLSTGDFQLQGEYSNAVHACAP